MRVGVAGWLRPRFGTPVTLEQPVAAGGGGAELNSVRDWTLGSGYADAAGKPFDELTVSLLEHKAADARIDLATYLHDNDIQQWVTYHPADRFWTFQLIETGIFVAVAAILLIMVAWRVKRRAL